MFLVENGKVKFSITQNWEGAGEEGGGGVEGKGERNYMSSETHIF
jgi:hypothetical protein